MARRVFSSARHILTQTQEYGSKSAIVAGANVTSFDQLRKGAQTIASNLLQAHDATDLKEQRIAFMANPDENFVKIQWGIWAAGGIAVPLHCHHPQAELEHVICDSGASAAVLSETLSNRSAVQDAATRHSVPLLQEIEGNNSLEQWDPNRFTPTRAAQILYTSGTTGKPKGVVMTHANIQQQIEDIVQAWELSKSDRLLHFLPLHHTHGILNNLLCPLYAGATVEMLPRADPTVIWQKYVANSKANEKLTVMMAVPTIYMKLLEEIDNWSGEDRARAIEGMRQLRLIISGSAGCPVRIIHKWENLTGHRLLERYGMTELGMVLTNPLHSERNIGYVGQTFPSVQVKLVDPKTEEESDSGELRVKGPTVFREYWDRPSDTAKEFDQNGWFKTGDIATYDTDRKSYRILGRASVDIIKTGGYKVSALEVETVLLDHPDVAECSVFGLEDETWGEKIVAVLRLRGASSSLADVQKHANQTLASYKPPQKWILVGEIPKNAMGKVNKKELKKSHSVIEAL